MPTRVRVLAGKAHVDRRRFAGRQAKGRLHLESPSPFPSSAAPSAPPHFGGHKHGQACTRLSPMVGRHARHGAQAPDLGSRVAERARACALSRMPAAPTALASFFGDQVIQGTWTEDRSSQPNIAVQELMPLMTALEQIVPQAAGRILILTTANAGNAFAINKKALATPPRRFDILFRMLDIAAKYDIYLNSHWIPRDENPLCDPISKGVRGVRVST